MNNPVRAYERSEWRSAGYRHHPYSIVCKTGFCDFRVFQTPVSVGGLQPRTSCLRHSYGVTLFRGMKPLNPCSARLSLYRHKDKRTKEFSPTKNMFLMFLCLNNNTHMVTFSPSVFSVWKIQGEWLQAEGVGGQHHTQGCQLTPSRCADFPYLANARRGRKRDLACVIFIDRRT